MNLRCKTQIKWIFSSNTLHGDLKRRNSSILSLFWLTQWCMESGYQNNHVDDLRPIKSGWDTNCGRDGQKSKWPEVQMVRSQMARSLKARSGDVARSLKARILIADGQKYRWTEVLIASSTLCYTICIPNVLPAALYRAVELCSALMSPNSSHSKNL